MKQVGVPFETCDPGDVEEITAGSPEDVAGRNALAKAVRVSETLRKGIIIGADTIVISGGRILGKPRDAAEAVEMLRTLRGSVHRVLTGLTVVDAETGRTETDLVETRVRMIPLSDKEIEGYVATGEPLGKAGAYAIQGLGAVMVEEIHGCFYNVVGLPLSRLNMLLRRFNVHILGDSEKKH